jgi:hypothetical protein
MSGVYPITGVFPMEGSTPAAGGGIAASLAGNTAGVLALVSSGTLMLAGGNNITVSQDGQSVTISAGAGGAGDGGNILAAGTRTAGSNSSVLFSNLNGVSFGLDTVNGSVMTATVQTNYQSAGAYLTTAALSQDSSKYAGTNGAITGGSITVNTSGVSVNLPAYLTTAQPPGAYLTTAALSQDSSKYAGINGAITGGSITVNTSGVSVNLPAYLTTAMASNRGSDFVQATAAFAGTNASGTIASGGISVSVAAGGGAVSFSAGTSSAALASIVFSNSNGVSFGLNGSTMTASAAGGAGGGATLVQFEPFPLLQANTTTWLPGIGSWYIQPFVLPQNLAAGRINYLIAKSNSSAGILRLSNGVSFASNTTGTRSMHYVAADTWALYTRGTGANDSILSSIWSNTRAYSITQSVSVILTNASNVRVSASHTVSYIGSIGTDGAYTLTTATASSSASSASVSMATSGLSAHMSSLFNLLSGSMIVNVGITKSLTPGNYWLAGGWSTSQTTGGTSNLDIDPFVHEVGLLGASSNAQSYRGWPQTVSNSSSQWMPGQGVFSAQSNAAPGTIAFGAIRTFTGNVFQYFNIVQSSL